MSSYDILAVFDSRQSPDLVKAAEKIASLSNDGMFWFGLGNTFAFKCDRSAGSILNEIGHDISRFVVVDIHSDTLNGSLPGPDWLRLNAEVFRHTFTSLLEKQRGEPVSEEHAERLIQQKREQIEEEKRQLQITNSGGS